MSTQGFLNTPPDQIFYTQEGQGPDLLFIHGMGIDHRVWNPQIPFFNSHYTCLRYDVRGFGKSVFKGSPQSHIAAEDIKSLLDSLKIQNIHIVGLSMGGNIALSFAQQYGEYVNKLVLVDADVQGFPHYSKEFSELLKETYEIGATKGALKAKLNWARNSLLSPKIINEFSPIMEVMLKDYSGLHFTNPKLLPKSSSLPYQNIKKVQTPSLVIIGEKDIEDFQMRADWLHENLPISQKRVIKGSGHLPNLEKPSEFNQILKEFLDS